MRPLPAGSLGAQTCEWGGGLSSPQRASQRAVPHSLRAPLPGGGGRALAKTMQSSHLESGA